MPSTSLLTEPRGQPHACRGDTAAWLPMANGKSCSEERRDQSPAQGSNPQASKPLQPVPPTAPVTAERLAGLERTRTFSPMHHVHMDTDSPKPPP